MSHTPEAAARRPLTTSELLAALPVITPAAPGDVDQVQAAALALIAPSPRTVRTARPVDAPGPDSVVR